MFPVGSVLLPHHELVLHIFEPRYRAMTRVCLAGDRRFGVVLIERGSEVGGGDTRCWAGTMAEITEAVAFQDGRFGLGLLGRERFRVTRWLTDDPYPRADVEPLVDRPSPELGPARVILERHLRKVVAMRTELGDVAPPATFELSPDPVEATWQASSLGGLGPADAQRVLEVDSAAERLALVTSILAEEESVLAQRMAGG